MPEMKITTRGPGIFSQLGTLHDRVAREADPVTRITVDAAVRDWMIQTIENAATTPGIPAAPSSLYGIPLIVDEEFERGQLRFHRGELQEDFIVHVPTESNPA